MELLRLLEEHWSRVRDEEEGEAKGVGFFGDASEPTPTIVEAGGLGCCGYGGGGSGGGGGGGCSGGGGGAAAGAAGASAAAGAAIPSSPILAHRVHESIISPRQEARQKNLQKARSSKAKRAECKN